MHSKEDKKQLGEKREMEQKKKVNLDKKANALGTKDEN